MWDGGNDNGRPEWQLGMMERQRERFASNMDATGPNQGDPPPPSYHNISPLPSLAPMLSCPNQGDPSTLTTASYLPLTYLTNFNGGHLQSTISQSGVADKVLRHGNVELVIPQKILNLRTRGTRPDLEKISSTSRCVGIEQTLLRFDVCIYVFVYVLFVVYSTLKRLLHNFCCLVCVSIFSLRICLPAYPLFCFGIVEPNSP